MRKLAVLLAVAALTVGLAACGGDDDDDAASTTSSTPAAESGLPDLGGKSVTVAVENEYLPFNYINQDTAKAAGLGLRRVERDLRERELQGGLQGSRRGKA